MIAYRLAENDQVLEVTRMLQHCVERAVLELHGNAYGAAIVPLCQSMESFQDRGGYFFAVEKVKRDNMLATQGSAELQVAIDGVKKKPMDVAVIAFDRHDAAAPIAVGVYALEMVLGVPHPLPERQIHFRCVDQWKRLGNSIERK